MGGYTEKFYRLSARNNLEQTYNQLIAMYVGGLRESLQDKLGLNYIWTLSQAINFAFKAEQEMQKNLGEGNHRRTS